MVVWNLENGTAESRFRYSGDLLALASTAAKEWTAVTRDRSGFRVWRWPSSDSAVRIPDANAGNLYGWAPAPVAISSDGLSLLVAGKDSAVRVWRIDDASWSATLSNSSGVERIEIDPAMRWIATKTAEGVVRVWRTGSWARVSELLHTAEVRDLTFSPDGGLLATSTADGYLNVWAPSTGRKLARFQLPQPADKVIVSKDSQSLLVVTNRGWISAFQWRATDLAEELCTRVLRDMTESEWRKYIGSRPHNSTCHPN